MSKIVKKDLLTLGIFDSVSNESLERLVSIGEKRRYKKGEHIFRDKEKVDNIYIILTGKVSLYKLNESAQKKIIFILGSNKIINAIIFDELPASISCELFESGEILSFERSKFIEVMKDDFELTTSVINSLTIKVRRLYRQMKNATPIKIEKRVAAKLWKLAKDYGVETDSGSIEINLNISVTYLADMFGAPRETISRALKILSKEGLIVVDRKRIVVIDRDKLAKFFKGN